MIFDETYYKNHLDIMHKIKNLEESIEKTTSTIWKIEQLSNSREKVSFKMEFPSSLNVLNVDKSLMLQALKSDLNLKRIELNKLFLNLKQELLKEN